jgi:hypothetical protein
LSAVASKELYFLLDRAGALIAYQEKGASWAGVLAFSSEAKAQEFRRTSNLEVAETAAIASDDRDAVAHLIAAVKPRAIRNLLLDLDYRTGLCTEVDFEGDRLGAVRERRFTPPHD